LSAFGAVVEHAPVVFGATLVVCTGYHGCGFSALKFQPSTMAPGVHRSYCTGEHQCAVAKRAVFKQRARKMQTEQLSCEEQHHIVR
jgi:hypothetical protein